MALYLRTEFNKMAGQTELSHHSNIRLSLRVESIEEVLDILDKAVSSGGSLTSQPKEHEWGYNGYFKDPDGHLWEVVYFNE